MFVGSSHGQALSWAIRMKVALGAAKGLAFLHEAEKPVIFRDFKASNILLDSVSCFGNLPTKNLIRLNIFVNVFQIF